MWPMPPCELKSGGKTCTADQHARFDEREWETGRYATASVLDSAGDWSEMHTSEILLTKYIILLYP